MSNVQLGYKLKHNRTFNFSMELSENLLARFEETLQTLNN